jgi:hypothetical protein
MILIIPDILEINFLPKLNLVRAWEKRSRARMENIKTSMEPSLSSIVSLYIAVVSRYRNREKSSLSLSLSEAASN